MEYPKTKAVVETLANGLTLIFDPDASVPVVSAQIWVETGSIHEDKKLGSGLSHFLEHMVFKGTRDYQSDELADAVQSAGGHWNAYTSFDRTVYYIDGPSKSLPEFLKCLTGLVFYPVLPESEFEKEKDVIRREIDMGLDHPDQVSSRLMFSTAFQVDPRKYPVIGHRHLFDEIEYQDLVDYHRARYTPDRCFVVIAGDFDASDVKKQIEQLTADSLQRGGREPLVAQDVPQLAIRRDRGFFDVPSSRISLAWKIPAMEDELTPAYEIMSAILGRGRSARLYDVLREELGLALEVSAFAWTFSGREGLFVMHAECLPENREVLIHKMIGELNRLLESDITLELAKAKRQIAVSQYRTLTSVSGRASDLGSNWHEARDLEFTRNYISALDKVDDGAVKKACRQLSAHRLTITVLDPIGCDTVEEELEVSSRRGDVVVVELPNHLRVALIEDHKVPLVYLHGSVRCGLLAEDESLQGISQLMASVIPKGTVNRDAKQMALTMETLGAGIGAGSGNNAFLVTASGLSEDIETILDVFSEVMISPAFSEDVIVREKASQLSAIEEALQDPLSSGFRMLKRSVFGDRGYGLDGLGCSTSVAAMTREDLVRHHQQYFNAQNSTIAIAGDFDSQRVMQWLVEKMGSYPVGQKWMPPFIVPKAGNEVLTHLPKKQAILTIGYPGTSVKHEDRYALAMIQEYASDMAGPLFTRIREELGLAYQVGATQFLGYDSGLFTFYMATSAEQLELAQEELLKEIEKIAQFGIKDEAFESVRATVLSGLLIQQQSSSSIAKQVSLDLLFDQSANLYSEQISIYETISHQHVAEVAMRIFSVRPTLSKVLPLGDGVN